MKYNIHRSEKRGGGDFGWLKTKYSFSFSSYYNPLRMGFGALKVLNDDEIFPHSGFGKHPHENMEIITIMLNGELTHEDSTGKKVKIKPAQIQVMSAGTGVVHSEKNESGSEVELLQIWIEPKITDVEPRYEEKNISLKENVLGEIVSGKKSKEKAFINQDASIYLGKFSKDKEINLKLKKGNGLFVFPIEGKLAFEKEIIDKRDSLEVTDAEKIKLKALSEVYLLIIEVPI